MTNEERQRHINTLRRMLNHHSPYSDSDPDAAVAAGIAALERDGQMEARLRWTMDTLEVALAETEGIWPTGGFEGYCAWIDSEIEREVFNG